MNSTITYTLSYEPHPFDSKMRESETKAWCLMEVITPEIGPKTINPVAIFNYNSDAERFQGHVLASGLDGKLVTIDAELKERFEFIQRRKSK